MLAVNTELYYPNKQAARWRAVVAATREVFDGLLTVRGGSRSGRTLLICWIPLADQSGGISCMPPAAAATALGASSMSAMCRWRRSPDTRKR